MPDPIANLPLIDHWSYSSLSLFLRNRLAFKKKYILKIYDDLYSPSAVVGQACHKAVELFLKGKSVNEAIATGLEHVNAYPDSSINYGKNGNREQMLKDYNAGVRFYFDEVPAWKTRELLAVEESFTQFIHDGDGNTLPIPAKCFVDAVWRSTKEETFADRTFPKGALFIEDHKFIRSYTGGDEDDPARFIQCMFNYHIVKEQYGEAPVAMLYRETKLSKNKSLEPQSQYYVVVFEEHADFFSVFYQLYNDCTREIARPDVTFLPNPYDLFDGQSSMLAYQQNLITVDAPVQVLHKTKEVKFAEKQYNASPADKVENKHLTPEEKIRLKLQEFGIPVEMRETFSNSSVTMYTLKPSRGVKMTTIEGHSKDLALALEARTIRVQAPIMGTDVVGIEIPNETRSTLNFLAADGTPSELAGLETGTFNIPIGMDVYGKVVKKDLREMPHVLIAGSTGSGKSVGLNVILRSLTHQNSSDDMKLILIDPKRVELSAFADLPHLLTGVIYDHEKAMRALKWLWEEMEARYKTLHAANCRNILAFNEENAAKIPYIVTVIDEFADLMLETQGGFVEWEYCEKHSPLNRRGYLTKLLTTKVKLRKKEQLLVEEVETCAGAEEEWSCKRHEYPPAEKLIVRLAQKARAVGIHLVIATQRPSVDVVTGLIKANMPTRIAYMTSSAMDSRVILDQAGAEELVGKGDMLFLDPSKRGLLRLQGFYA